MSKKHDINQWLLSYPNLTKFKYWYRLLDNQIGIINSLNKAYIQFAIRVHVGIDYSTQKYIWHYDSQKKFLRLLKEKIPQLNLQTLISFSINKKSIKVDVDMKYFKKPTPEKLLMMIWILHIYSKNSKSSPLYNILEETVGCSKFELQLIRNRHESIHKTVCDTYHLFFSNLTPIIINIRC